MKNPAERLKKIRQIFGLTQAKFAEKINVKWDKIKDIETTRHKLRPELAEKIEKVYGVSSKWLLNGKGEIFIENKVIDDEIVVLSKKDNFIDVPLIDLILKNNGEYNIINKSYMKFLPEFLNFLEVKDFNKIYLIFMKEDSMETMIENNDIVLIDTVDTNLIPGKVYAIKIDNNILIRKIFFDYSEKYILRSENKEEFQDILIPKEEFFKNKYLLGRVKWIGKKI